MHLTIPTHRTMVLILVIIAGLISGLISSFASFTLGVYPPPCFGTPPNYDWILPAILPPASFFVLSMVVSIIIAKRGPKKTYVSLSILRFILLILLSSVLAGFLFVAIYMVLAAIRTLQLYTILLGVSFAAASLVIGLYIWKEADKGYGPLRFYLPVYFGLLLGFSTMIIVAFPPVSLCPVQMIASPGYLSYRPSLNTSGTLSFVFGQSIGATEYNIELACSTATYNQTVPQHEWSAILASGTAKYPITNNLISNATSLASGETLNITGLPCYNTAGNSIATKSVPAGIGTLFSGSIWLNYTTAMCSPTASRCNWTTVRVSVFTTRVI